ncbi:MAG: CBS domain-containing protein [Patescibacteria group bacterium]
MLYFSELEGKRIYTEDRIEVGALEDIIFVASANPVVSKLVIRTLKKTKLILPFSYVLHIGITIVIKKAYLIGELTENELFIKKNLLDKQIIDIGGNKIVRVNDVSIQEKVTTNLYELYITGVDVGLLGVLRRLGIESLVLRFLRIFNYNLTSDFLPWGDIQPLELSRGKVKLKITDNKLQNIRPEDLADYLEQTNEKNVRKFLNILDKNFSSEVVENLNINYQRDLIQYWEPKKSASVIESIQPDEAVDILLAISKKKRDEILSLVNEKTKKELMHLIGLSRTSIGRFITSEYLTVSPIDTTRKVIDQIKKETREFSFIAAIYVVNTDKQLVGVFNLHDLLLNEWDTPVYKFMVQNLIEIRITTPIEIAIRKILRYRLPALPVVDKDKHILGILTFDHITEYMTKRLDN